MEIKVLDGKIDKNTGFYVVKNFEYLGITVLGDNVTPAMGDDAKIQMYSKQNKKEYFSMVENLSKELKSLQKENEVELLKTKETFAEKKEEDTNIEKNSCHDDKEVIEKNSCHDDEESKNKAEKNSCHNDKKNKTEKNAVECEDEAEEDEKNSNSNLNVQKEIKEIEEAENMSTKEKKKNKTEKNTIECEDEDEEETCLSKKEFAKKDTSSNVSSTNSLSINYLIEEITTQLDNITEVVQVWWQDTPATVPQYYLIDLLVDKNVVIVTDFENTGFYGIPYSVTGDEVQLQMSDIAPYVSIWKQKETSEVNTQNFSTKKFALENLLKGGEEVYNNLKKEYEKIEKENKSLKEFKLEIDKQTRFVEIDNKVNEFGFREEEVKDVKEMAYAEKITIEELEKELYALAGKKAFEKKGKFSLNKKQNPTYKINIKEPKVEASKYGSASIYFDK